MTDFDKLKPAETIDQIRNFLASIGSLALESDETPERIPLDPEIAKTLSDDEVELLSKAYVQSSLWQKVREGDENRKPVARDDGETASAYLIRLVRYEVEQLHQSAKQMHEKMLGPSRSLFDQVRKSTSALGSTLSAYEQLTKAAKPVPMGIQPIHTDHFDALNRQMAEQARERAEERAEEMVLARLTGQMTAESAKTLKDLAEAATTLMEQFDERDRKTDKSTRKQITIAVWSVVISAVLALVALILSGFAYYQDKNTNESDDRWQSELTAAIRDSGLQRETAEKEMQRLRDQVVELEAKIARIESAQGSAFPDKNADSSARRATSLGKTLPPP